MEDVVAYPRDFGLGIDSLLGIVIATVVSILIHMLATKNRSPDLLPIDWTKGMGKLIN